MRQQHKESKERERAALEQQKAKGVEYQEERGGAAAIGRHGTGAATTSGHKEMTTREARSGSRAARKAEGPNRGPLQPFPVGSGKGNAARRDGTNTSGPLLRHAHHEVSKLREATEGRTAKLPWRPKEPGGPWEGNAGVAARACRGRPAGACAPTQSHCPRFVNTVVKVVSAHGCNAPLGTGHRRPSRKRASTLAAAYPEAWDKPRTSRNRCRPSRK